MNYWKGKGAQINVANRFLEHHISTEDLDGIDEELIDSKPRTEVFYETPKKVISYNNSPDVGMEASVNPYQGCEHGCLYCYARNSHEYWGFSAGLDFESKIIVKKDLIPLLEQSFLKQSYKPKVLMLSGNTDCYQPLERKFKLTRGVLKLCLKYRHPVAIVTKNALVEKDLDILEELADDNLVRVIFSITTKNEKLRRILEPRTSSAINKLKTIERLSKVNIPVGIMNAPIIPSLNHHEIPEILKSTASCGAKFAGYTVVRLNGQISNIFRDWLVKNFPDRADKVWHQIEALHKGKVNDSEFKKRMSGEGEIAAVIKQLFKVSVRKYFPQNEIAPLNLASFRKGGNYSFF